jgi:hypothetical protein
MNSDAYEINDHVRSEMFIVALPIIEATLVFPDTVVENMPFTANVPLVNRSAFGVMPAGVVTFCLFDFDVGCGSGTGAPFGLEQVPSLAPGETWQKTVTLAIPPIDDRHYANWRWDLLACIGDPGATLASMLVWNNRTCVTKSRQLFLRAGAGS